MSVKVQKKKNSAIKELNDLIKKYPTIPQFKNLLGTLYEKQGNHFMVEELNRRVVSLHPDYLFGKLNQAFTFIANKEFDKVTEILGKEMEIKALYPEREEFHYTEVLGFLQLAFSYFIGIEDAEQAQFQLDIIEKLNEELQLGLNIAEFDRKIMLLNLDKNLKLQELEWANIRTPDVKAKKIIENNEVPQFNHSIVNLLYNNSMKIDPQIITDILALPHETLLEDLHKVVYDSIARYEHYSYIDWDIQTHEFVMHALLLLVELKDERSVEVFLDVLRQDHDYLEIWFSDFLTDGMWELLYAIANHKLELLFNFVIEPNGYTYSKSCVSQAVEQIGYYQPERRQEIIDWYKRIFKFWVNNEKNDDIIDTELIAFFVSDMVNLQLVELKPEIIELFDHDLVAKGVSGSLESCLNDIDEISTINHKNAKFDSIYERYENYTSNWLTYTDEDDNYFVDNDEDDKDIEDAIYEEVKKIIPLPDNKPKVGRNESCPCGSGKKFKKCCGN